MTGHRVAPIVVADDDPAVRHVIREFLAAARLRNPVIEVGSGPEAVEVVRRVTPGPALVLLDVMMPDGGGIDALALLRREPRLAALPVVMLSGSTDSVHIEEAHRLGASSYLVKPVGMGALVDVIQNLDLPWALQTEPGADPSAGSWLPDRPSFLAALGARGATAERSPSSAAVVLVGLDRFTAVNHALGNDAGDALLDAVGDRLEELLVPGDVLARLGGDEFGVLADVDDATGAAMLGEHLLDAFHEPFVLPGARTPLYVSASVGIEVVPVEFEPADVLAPLRSAEVAMEAAKRAGGGQVQMSEPGLQTIANNRYRLEIDLAGAAGRGELELRFQPVLDLETGAVPGVEALVRWRHPDLGLLGPGQFIELAEDSGIIHSVGEWVLEETCRQIGRWAGGPATSDLYVAVNLSPYQLRHPDLVDGVVNLLLDTGTDPRCLHLEVTESALAPREEDIPDRLEKLRAAGMTVALDDFGTGYSSLARLGTLPIDVVKIDQSFTAGIAEGPEHWSIASAIVNLARRLGKQTLAEGIEDYAQLAHLRSLHVGQGQGFLFAEPLTPGDLEEWLGARPALTRS